MKNRSSEKKKSEVLERKTRMQRWRETGRNWWEKAVELNAEFWRFKWPLVIFTTVKDFIQSKYFSRDVPSLTFSTAMSLIPLLAMFFAVGRGFGQASDIEAWLRNAFVAQPEVADTLMKYVNNYLVNYQGQYVFIVGFGLMVYSLHFLMQDIEGVFDRIWKVKERPFGKRLFVYASYYVFFGVMVFASSFFTVASMVVTETMQEWIGWWNISEMMSWVISIIPMSIFFIVTYKALPHAYVPWNKVVVPGCLAGFFTVVLQQAFLALQVYLTSYNIIYGSLAVIPLLLLLLKWSWGICIFFAEMVHKNQHSELLKCDEGLKVFSHRMQLQLAKRVVETIYEETRQEPYSATPVVIAEKTDLPLRIVCEVLALLKDKFLINEIENDHDGNYEEIAHFALVRESLLDFKVLTEAFENAGGGEEKLQELCEKSKEKQE